MGDGNTFPSFVCVCFQVILAYESIVLCMCSGNVLIGSWLLNFNAGKCKVPHVGARNGRANYFMEGTEIQAVSEEKDLGVVVDNKLRFSRHIAAAAACANRKLGLLKHTFKY